MDEQTVSLRPADAETLDDVERLLDENGLPTADIRTKPGCFFVGVDGDDRVGVGGIEPSPPDGVLRSVVVRESRRGTGVGGALCDRLEEEATAEGIETLYLLTTTAADFFAARGYEEIDRERVPESIQASSQFAELCPSTAVCMRKRL